MRYTLKTLAARLWSHTFAKRRSDFTPGTSYYSSSPSRKNAPALTGLVALEDRNAPGNTVGIPGIIGGGVLDPVTPFRDYFGESALVRTYNSPSENSQSPTPTVAISNLDQDLPPVNLEEAKNGGGNQNQLIVGELQRPNLNINFSLPNSSESNSTTKSGIDPVTGGSASGGTSNQTSSQFRQDLVSGSLNTSSGADPASSPISGNDNQNTSQSSNSSDSGTTSSTSTAPSETNETGSQTTAPETKTVNRWIQQAYQKLGLTFERNVGQTDKRVDFISRGQGYSLFLNRSEATFVLANGKTETKDSERGNLVTQSALKIQLVDSIAEGTITGEETAIARSNYFKGESFQDIEQYSKIRYGNVYEGVDLVYYSTSDHQLEYDFVVKPGANLDQIKLKFDGADSVRVNERGDLEITTGAGTVTQKAPVLYQKNGDTGSAKLSGDGSRKDVAGSFVQNDDGTIGFRAGEFDKTQALYVDPIVSFAAAIGGSNWDEAMSVASDQAGNAYIAGWTASANYPVTTGTLQGPTDAFVTKFQANGLVIYSTYLGGLGADAAHDIALDISGNAIVSGITSSPNFQTTAGAYKTTMAGASDYFVVKLDSTGSQLMYSTLLDGTPFSNAITGHNGGGLVGAIGAGRSSVALDINGNAYVVGTTANPAFPTLNASQAIYGGGASDAFLVKLNNTGSGVGFATFLGGTGSDFGHGVAVDPTGNVYIAGTTASVNLPTTVGAFQFAAPPNLNGFVAKYNNAGVKQWATYLGGAGDDSLLDVAVDITGSPYVTGWTTNPSYPTTAVFGIGGPFFTVLTKFNTNGGMVYSDLYGAMTVGRGVQVSIIGQAFVTGTIAVGGNVPMINPIVMTAGGIDNFLFTVDPPGFGLTFSSRLGGVGADYANGLSLNFDGTAYIAGATNSPNYPAPHPVGGPMDAFVIAIGNKPPAPVITAITTDTGSSGTDFITNDTTLTISGTATASAMVIVYQAGVALGTTTASPMGTWSFTLAAVLAEGTYSFTARAVSLGQTSPESIAKLVQVDLTAPEVYLEIDASTGDLSPRVYGYVFDAYAIPNGTQIRFDVDLNNDGSFTSGELNYAIGTLNNNYVQLDLPQLPSLGNYKIRASVTDLAGNIGYSTVENFSVVAVTPWVLNAQHKKYDPLAWTTVAHGLDLDTSPGAGSSPSLVYNSETVDVRPTVSASITTDNTTTTLPASFTVDLIVTPPGGSAVTYTTTFSTAGKTPGDVLNFAVQVGSPITTEGRHTWTMNVNFPSGSGIPTKTSSGAFYVSPRDNSQYGAGWGLSSVDRLVNLGASGGYPAGIMWVSGSGGVEFYAENGSGGYNNPQGDNGKLEALGGGGWRYTTPEGATKTFNASGFQIESKSADGNQKVEITPDIGGHPVGTYKAVDGTVSIFNYNITTNLLDSISVGSRTTTLDTSSTFGKLTKITDPDGRYRDFTYSGDWLIQEDFGGVRTAWGYTSSGHLNTVSVGIGVDQSTSYIISETVAYLNGLTAGQIMGWTMDATNRDSWIQTDNYGRILATIAANGTWQRWTRDSEGRVLTHKDELERTTTYVRDSLGYVTKATNADGSFSEFTYQAGEYGNSNLYHKLLSEKNERGNTTNYQYDTVGRVTEVKNPLNQKVTTTYVSSGNGVGLVDTVLDDNGNLIADYDYDTTKRVIKTTNRDGKFVTTGYDGNGNTNSVTDELNKTSTSTNDAMGRTLTTTVPNAGTILTNVYDNRGLLKTSVDGNNVLSRITRDGRGNVKTQTIAEGTTAVAKTWFGYDLADMTIRVDDVNGGINTFARDAVGNILKNIDVIGGETESSWFNLDSSTKTSTDARGGKTGYGYNLLGWMNSITDSFGKIADTIFNAVGSVTRSEDELNHGTDFVKDALERTTSATDATGKTVGQTFDNLGRVDTVTDQNGRVTKYGYDNLNRKTSITDAFGTADARTRYITYTDTHLVKTQTDGLWLTTFDYDDLGRKIKQTDPLGHFVEWEYDSNSNVTKYKDGLGKVTQFYYDAQNRKIKETDPNNNSQYWYYNGAGNLTAFVDGMGNVTQYFYDDEGLLRLTLAPDWGMTYREYDAEKNLTKIVDPVGNTTTYEYDSNNRLKKETDPLGKVKTYEYDDANRLTKTTDRLNRVIEYTYNNRNQLTQELWKDAGGTTVDTLSYNYNDDGQMLSATKGGVGYSFTYDNLARLKTQTDIYGLVQTFTYNAADDRTQVSSSISVEDSVYDAAHRLTSRTSNNIGTSGAKVEFNYDNRNLLTEAKRYSDSAGLTLIGSTVLGYDNGGRLTNQDHKNAAGTILVSYVNAYDSANRITSETRNGTPKSYNYDSKSQLLSDGTSSYTYDANGNRTMAGYSTIGANRIQSDGVSTYLYDDEGNTTRKTNIASGNYWTYQYDNRNEMTVAESYNSMGMLVKRVEYTYDVFGNMVTEAVVVGGSSITKFAYRIGNTGTGFTKSVHELWAEVNTSSGVVATRLYLLGDGEGSRLARSDSSGVAWLLQDRLGNVREVTDNSGSIVKEVNYDGFGKIVSNTGTGTLGNFTFTGLYLSPETGFIGAKHRWYNVETGAWQTEDPIGFTAGDMNTRRYVGNNGVNSTDRSGLVVIFVHGIMSLGEFSDPMYSAMSTYWESTKQTSQMGINFKWAGWDPKEKRPETANILEAASTTASARKLETNGNGIKNLTKFIKELRKILPEGEPINIVAHSEGTVITLAALQDLAKDKISVDNVILLNSPLKINQAQDELDKALPAAKTITHVWSAKESTVTAVNGVGPVKGLVRPNKPFLNTDGKTLNDYQPRVGGLFRQIEISDLAPDHTGEQSAYAQRFGPTYASVFSKDYSRKTDLAEDADFRKSLKKLLGQYEYVNLTTPRILPGKYKLIKDFPGSPGK